MRTAFSLYVVGMFGATCCCEEADVSVDVLDSAGAPVVVEEKDKGGTVTKKPLSSLRSGVKVDPMQGQWQNILSDDASHFTFDGNLNTNIDLFNHFNSPRKGAAYTIKVGYQCTKTKEVAPPLKPPLGREQEKVWHYATWGLGQKTSQGGVDLTLPKPGKK
jgi:hypothetical protein